MKERYLLEDGSDNGFSLITDYDGNDEQAFDVNVKSGEILPINIFFRYSLYVTWCCFLEYSCRSQWAVSLL